MDDEDEDVEMKAKNEAMLPEPPRAEEASAKNAGKLQADCLGS